MAAFGFMASAAFMASLAALPFFPTAVPVAALAAAPTSAPVEQPSGSVFVSTLPAGADVWIDGTYVGRSPALASALAIGKHTLTLTKSGWVVQEVGVDVKAGATALSAVRLTPKPPHPGASRDSGRYVLRGVPRGAKVLVDGLPAPGDGLLPGSLAAGTHRVVLLGAHGRTARTFEVWPDTTTEVVLREPDEAEARSAVVAPASAYLPAGVCAVEGKKIVVRYGGHVVVARFGESDVRYDGALVSYAGAPQSIGGKLYLPLELLERLRSDPKPEPDPSRTR